jgi:hypothetical protein
MAPNGSHILPIADDVVFMPGALEQAIEVMNGQFPGGNGVVGLHVKNFNASPYAFMLIGRGFLQNDLGGVLFHSGYKHFFADTELGECARSRGKFYLSAAEVIHHHPASGAAEDSTHRRSRQENWTDDHALYEKRKAQLRPGVLTR